MLTLPTPTLRGPSDTEASDTEAGVGSPGGPAVVQLVQRGHLAIFDPELRGSVGSRFGSVIARLHSSNLRGLYCV